jgi:GNAT superfamily N-acetyltransferase
MNKNFTLIESNIKEINGLLNSHKSHLAHPMDSYCEDKLDESTIYRIIHEGTDIGYAGIIGDELRFFHVLPVYFKYAPDAFEYCIKQKGIKTVNVMTQDSLLVSLIVEWNFRVEKEGCYFVDAGRQEKPQVEASRAQFRTADLSDMPAIIKETGDFFDKLEERINAETIFVLEEGNDLMGCGIVEQGRLFKDCVSIGMITCREHRKKGVAQTILWHLKEWAYLQNLKPIAGCWYYNVLSRKSLEAAGMIAASKGFNAVLLRKEELPLRTGNPPGELV